MFQDNSKSFIALATGLFAVSLAVGAFVLPTSSAHLAPEPEGAHASWVSQARTVDQQVLEADMVVRVQVVDRAPARHLWHPTPDGVMHASGQGTFAFTDTQVEVLEVYAGKTRVGDRLWIMQTGADLVTTEGLVSRMELAEDPLYEQGDEMVLFLVDISGDPVHAAGRQLARTVNPAGRYQVDGGLVGQFAMSNDQEKVAILDLASLEGQIRTAVETRLDMER